MSAVKAKLAALTAAKRLNRGGVIAHHTATVPGVAAAARNRRAMHQLCRFKQRPGPFLLLADSITTARRQMRYFSPYLRRQIKQSWPGAVTMIVPGKPGLPATCYQGSRIAIRVDASLQTRQLARACGGLLLSSSLNRKGGATQKPDRKLRMRWSRHLGAVLPGAPGSGKASLLMRVWRNDSTIIRP